MLTVRRPAKVPYGNRQMRPLPKSRAFTNMSQEESRTVCEAGSSDHALALEVGGGQYDSDESGGRYEVPSREEKYCIQSLPGQRRRVRGTWFTRLAGEDKQGGSEDAMP